MPDPTVGQTLRPTLENRTLLPLYQNPNGPGVSGVLFGRYRPQGMAGGDGRLQSAPLDDGGSGGLGSSARAAPVLQSSPRIALGLARAHSAAPAQPPLLETPASPHLEEPSAQATQAPSLRAASHSSIPKRFR